MKWMRCINDTGCSRLKKGDKYLIERIWRLRFDTRVKVVKDEWSNLGFLASVARFEPITEPRTPLFQQPMKDETPLPTITNYIVVDNYTIHENGIFKTLDELHDYLSNFDEEELDDFIIIFVYSNGNVTKRPLSDVIRTTITLKPEFI